jgi:transcriptional regulator with XRE-family HTH domain
MGIKKVKRTIGARVKDERRRRGLEQEDLAEISEVATKTIGQIENFKGNPTLKTMDKLARAFKMELEEFFCDSE